MDGVKNEDKSIKRHNHAWRKKPRRFAPKSRLGCKTCKIRRVKCDLSQPSCLKCRSTGRTCDGYNDALFAFNARIGLSHRYNDEANGGDDLVVQSPGPLMILPQAEAMSFFEYVSIKHLNIHPCESWRNTLMYFSQTVPAVRHAAISVALMHRKYMDRHSSDHVRQTRFLKDELAEKTPLLHYNRAIQLLLNQNVEDSTETAAITLLICYLLACFDHLAGNHVQAMHHLRGGIEVSKAMLNNENNDTQLSWVLYQVTRQISRLDMQALTFLVDWTPADIQETLASQFLASDGAFRSFDEAADHLHILVAQVMRLRNTEQQMIPKCTVLSPIPSPIKDILFRQLETWLSLFENMLQQGSSNMTDSQAHRLISLLRLQYTVICILLQCSGPGREMDYDNFLPQFQQSIALANHAAANERATFTPEIGIIPVLYIIGVKCRHPEVRREALRILRRQPIREAVWDSIAAARVVQRMIEIEESASKEETIQSMEQIAVWQRVETVSWVHVVGGDCPARLDLTFTLCGQEGKHMEVLMI